MGKNADLEAIARRLNEFYDRKDLQVIEREIERNHWNPLAVWAFIEHRIRRDTAKMKLKKPMPVAYYLFLYRSTHY